MDQLFLELAKYGIAGLMAFLFYKLYTEEKKAHEVTRGKLIDSLGARIIDSKETVTKVTEPLEAMAYGIKNISNKIEVSKGTQ